jgi:recombination protein RecT
MEKSGSEVAKQKATPSERFTNAVLKEFVGNVGEVETSAFQKRLIQNYFIKLDQTLKASELKRLAKKTNQDPVQLTWDNINMPKLATDVMSFSLIGLDALQSNHINLIPYKNNATGKYDITFIIGYKGLELKAMKYGFEIPDDVVVELVYSNDKFKQIKKDINNRVEGYTFEVIDDFNRGEVVGGFYYHIFIKNSTKNKLKVFSLKDIEKRKPKYASSEFWGGTVDKWENGKKVGVEQIDGWRDEMMLKTIYRSAYNDITIDSQKIDEHLIRMMDNDSHDKTIPTTEDVIAEEISENANTEIIDFDEVIEVETPKVEVKTESKKETVKDLFEEPTKSAITPEAGF